jgi:hypothetical protein
MEWKLGDEGQPCIPQFTKNPLYRYTFAHGLHCEPTRYYITYDFETAYEPVDEAIKLVAVSVAMTVYLPNETITKSFRIDTSEPDKFIYDFIQALYDNGALVKQANINNFLSFIPTEKHTDFFC